MISDYDKIHNRLSKLEKSKWTSLEKLNGWKHYEVINVDNKNDQIELFAICEKEKRVMVKKVDLKNKKIWKRGWDPNYKNDDIGDTLFDKLIDGTISRAQAAKEVRQIARRKAEAELLNKVNEKKLL